MTQPHPNTDPNRQEDDIFYPVSKAILPCIQNPFRTGNFALWYNKYIPIILSRNTEDTFKPCNPGFIRINGKYKDKIDKAKQYIEYYHEQAKAFYDSELIKVLLQEKHKQQTQFLKTAAAHGRESIEIWAKTTTRFITGIGNIHPSEISITLDHNIGVPYIPASSIKGIVRFFNAINLMEHFPDGSFNDVEHSETKELFGSSAEDLKKLKNLSGNRGSILFLDAYPEPPINIGIDIINPHYVKYYEPANKSTWPADHLGPVPVKFLVVEPGTCFVFRCVMPSPYKDKIFNIFKKTFEEGIGAKTSLGYGKFEEIPNESPIKNQIQNLKIPSNEKTAEKDDLDPEKQALKQVKALKKDRDQIGRLTKQLLEGNYSLSVYQELKNKLKELNEWEPEKGNAYQKMLDRKNKIENKIKTLSQNERE